MLHCDLPGTGLKKCKPANLEQRSVKQVYAKFHSVGANVDSQLLARLTARLGNLRDGQRRRIGSEDTRLPSLVSGLNSVLKTCSLRFAVQEPKEIPLDFQALNDRFNHQIRVGHRFATTETYQTDVPPSRGYESHTRPW